MFKPILAGLVGIALAIQFASAQEFGHSPLQAERAVQATPPPTDFPGPMDQTLPPDATQTPAALPAVVPGEAKPPVKLWEGSFELGLNGTEGNSRTFNFRFGAKVKRKTEFNILSADLDYRRDSANSIDTANKALLDWRYEHLFSESPWTCFVHGTVDYDEFKVYDLRVSLDAGLGYRFIKNDSTNLTGRFGGGTSREFGGPNEEFVPEAVFGLDFDHKINSRHKLVFSSEYRPDVTDFENFRLTNKAAWEILLDEAMHLSMKLSVLDRYDATPGEKEPNDLDYSVMLMWSY